MLNKDKEFVKEIKIDKKKRLKYNIITLIIFNALLLSSLIYMSALIFKAVTIVISVIIFILSLIGSVRTILKSKDNRKYVVYRDKIAIQSTTFSGDVPLKNVFMVKAKRNIFDVIFKKSAHMLIIYAKNKNKEIYMLPFIGEDTEILADKIMKLAITARARNKDKNLIVKKINLSSNQEKK